MNSNDNELPDLYAVNPKASGSCLASENSHSPLEKFGLGRGTTRLPKRQKCSQKTECRLHSISSAYQHIACASRF